MAKLMLFSIIASLSAISINCENYKTYNFEKYCTNNNENGNSKITIETDDDDSAIILKFDDRYRNNMNCGLFITAEDDDYGIVVTANRVQLRDVVDRLKIFSSKPFKRYWTWNNIDDGKESQSIVAGKYLEVVFYSGYSSQSTKNKGFELILTSYKKADGSCRKSQFDCGDNRCISSKFRCDGHNNCGNSNDELGCKYGTKTFSIGSSLLIIGLALGLLYCCCRCCRSKDKTYILVDNDKKVVIEGSPHSMADPMPSAPINTHQNKNYGTVGDDYSKYPPYPVQRTSYASEPTPVNLYPPPPPYSPKN